MPIRTIPDDVRRFIQASIDSIAQLEALLIVHEHPGIEWTVSALSERLYISLSRPRQFCSACAPIGWWWSRGMTTPDSDISRIRTSGGIW